MAISNIQLLLSSLSCKEGIAGGKEDFGDDDKSAKPDFEDDDKYAKPEGPGSLP